MSAICSSHGDAPDSDGGSLGGLQPYGGGDESSLGMSLVPPERGWNLEGSDSRILVAKFRGVQVGRWPRPANDQSLTARLQSRKPDRRFRLRIDPAGTLGGGGQ